MTAQPSTFQPAALPVADRALLDLVDRLHSGLFDEGGETLTYALPSESERERLASRDRQLSSILRAASDIPNGNSRIALAITAMFAGYLNAKASDAKAATAAYVKELGRYPAWAVERACMAVSSGSVSGLSPDFPPSAPRLAQVAQGYLDEHLQGKRKIQKVLSAKLVYQPSEGERERVHTGLVELADTLREKARFNDPDEVQRKARAAEQARQANERDIRAAREAANLPALESGKVLVSPSLLKTLESR